MCYLKFTLNDFFKNYGFPFRVGSFPGRFQFQLVFFVSVPVLTYSGRVGSGSFPTRPGTALPRLVDGKSEAFNFEPYFSLAAEFPFISRSAIKKITGLHLRFIP